MARKRLDASQPLSDGLRPVRGTPERADGYSATVRLKSALGAGKGEGKR